MEKLFRTVGKIYYISGDSKIEHQLSSYFSYNRRIVEFEVAGVPIVALCTVPNNRKIPHRINLNEECTLFSGILSYNRKRKDDQEGYNIVVESTVDFLLQLLEQEPYATEEQKNKILKLKSE